MALEGDPGQPALRLPPRGARRPTRAPGRPTRSATSTWRRGCRSSCGRAAPDQELLRRRRGRPAVAPGGARAAGARACWPTRAPTRSATRFAAQWLRLQDLDKVHPDVRLLSRLRRAARRRRCGARPRLFFHHLVRDDRRVLDLFTADYTFVERAAGAALRHSRRRRRPSSAGDLSRRARAAACSATAACWC